MTDQSRKEQLERSIRLLQQVDDPTTREKLRELRDALETEREGIIAPQPPKQ